jgi:hypothetical protein
MHCLAKRTLGVLEDGNVKCQMSERQNVGGMIHLVFEYD